jgi:signal peptidase I
MPDLREVKEFLKDTLAYIIVIILTMLVFIYVFSFQQVIGNSMSPVLNDGDVAFLSKITYRISKVKRNDVIALKTNDGKVYVKRVIGLPGESISYMNNILYINNEPFTEEFLGEEVNTNNFMFEDICSKEDCPNGVIPDNMYFVLGDNREDSLDSRDPSLGLVPKDNIIGKSLIRIWPLNKISKT